MDHRRVFKASLLVSHVEDDHLYSEFLLQTLYTDLWRNIFPSSMTFIHNLQLWVRVVRQETLGASLTSFYASKDQHKVYKDVTKWVLLKHTKH